jgi:serine/threonine kinase 38
MVLCATAELKKKSSKPKRPTIKTLFGNLPVYIFFLPFSSYALDVLTICMYLLVTESMNEEEPVQGSFKNMLPHKEGQPSSHSSIPPEQYQPRRK